MGAMDKAKDKAQQAFGKAKERMGEAADDEDLKNSGKRDQLEGEAKEAGRDLKDKAAGTAHDAKERWQDDDSENR
ncbi:hypothetical protein GCM10027447_20820 [Glycomyces halotolerans]